MENGEAVAQRLRGDRMGGIPWMTILDADGNELITSDGPDGNIGCPASEDERAHFVTTMRKTIQHAPPERIDEIAEALERFSKTL